MASTSRAVQFTPPMRTRGRPRGAASSRERVVSKSSRSQIQSESTTIDTYNLEILLSKTLTTHHCTPLYRFDATQFHAYAQDFQEWLKGQLQGIAQAAEEAVAAIDGEYEKNNEEETGIRKGWKIIDLSFFELDVEVENDYLADPFGVKISCQANSNAKEQAYYAIFFSARKNDYPELLKGKASQFSPYPVLLLKAPQWLTNLISEWFQTKFDCRICKFRLQPFELMEMAEQWAQWQLKDRVRDGNRIPGRKYLARPLELTYALGDITELKTITLTITLEDAKQIYEKVQRLSRRSDQDITLIQGVESHFLHHSNIHLSRLSLVRLGTNVAYVASEGKIKLFPVMDVRLTYLMIDQLLTYNLRQNTSYFS
ncbi:uncharacterized protein VTP21DRAFT_1571 [Calcarisporiella thermophila]|uniref:uncharacterized protein n=1 Tax=Calcarisporiella thermophila TaxID=911321 RepID=UPI003744AD56